MRAAGERSFLRLAAWVLAQAVASCLLASEPTPQQIEFFEKRIRPLLAERCELCHSAAKGKTSGGLALDTRDGWQKGGDSGPPITPGKPDESLLLDALRHDGIEEFGRGRQAELADVEPEDVARVHPLCYGKRVGAA